jgi:copper homeostasis protein
MVKRREGKMKRLVEVCAGSYEDCLNASFGGADRVELNSALSVGGLTPGIATLRRVKQDTDLKVICMVRPRAAGFCYTEKEKEVMFEEAELLLGNGADGLAFGFLHEDGSIEEESTKRMIDLIHEGKKEAVFHRAFDVCRDAHAAMELLISLGADRVLTSGQREKAMEGKELLKELQETYGSGIELLAGSGVNADNAAELMAYTGIWQVHSSCKAYYEDKTTVGEDVSYAYLPAPHERCYDGVSLEAVRRLTEVLQNDFEELIR